MIGIYAIRNRKNKKIYIGQSIDIAKRWNEHIRDLEKGEHHSYLLQNDWNEYELKNFSFIILENLTPPSDFLYDENKLQLLLICREYYYSKELDTFKNGYNIEHTYESIMQGKYQNAKNPKNFKLDLEILVNQCPNLLNKEFDKTEILPYLSIMDKSLECNTNINQIKDKTENKNENENSAKKVLSQSNDVLTISKIRHLLPSDFTRKYEERVLYYAFIKMGFLYYETNEHNYRWRANNKGVESGYFYREIIGRSFRTYWTKRGIEKAIDIANNIDDYIEPNELTVSTDKYTIEKGLTKLTIRKELYDNTGDSVQ